MHIQKIYKHIIRPLRDASDDIQIKADQGETFYVTENLYFTFHIETQKQEPQNHKKLCNTNKHTHARYYYYIVIFSNEKHGPLK